MGCSINYDKSCYDFTVGIGQVMLVLGLFHTNVSILSSHFYSTTFFYLLYGFHAYQLIFGSVQIILSVLG